MSISELWFRTNQLIKNLIRKRKYCRYIPDINDYSVTGKINILPEIDLKKIEFPGKIKIFGIEFDYTRNINWHLDISSNKTFPLIYSKDINIRTEKYGSAKFVWEINRMLFLPWICLNYRISGNSRYLKLFQNIINSWAKQNPYLLGINWNSNIEINIRLINWAFCWEILDAYSLIKKNPEFNKFVFEKWLPQIYLHCKYSYSNPSKFSSANNHLICEYAGLFIATSLWKFKQSVKWNNYAKSGLEREIHKQHSENGVNKEEAAEYIQFITDFFLISYLVGIKSNNPLSEKYNQKLKKIIYYIYEMLDSKGNFPQYGDEDDGKVILLSADSNFNNFKSILTTGAIIYADPLLKSKSDGFDLKNTLLLAKEGQKLFDSLKNVPVKIKTTLYEKEGHFIMKEKKNNREIYIHFNAAPTGYLSTAAHGHADALSFIMHLNGKPFFIDSGTYTYHTHPEWRKYFTGTISHNTIRINREDQALYVGPTLWLNHYRTTLIKSYTNETTDQIIACHNGYKKIGVMHQRELTFNKEKGIIYLNDNIIITRRRKFFIEMLFHLHPSVNIKSIEKNIIKLYDNTGNEVLFKSDKILNMNVIKGKLQPILGWYSPLFYQKTPTHTIYYSISAENTCSFSTEIKILN
jgi:hypothetical protein